MWVAATAVFSLVAVEAACRVIYSRKLDYQIEMSRYAAALKRSSEHWEIGHEHRPSASAHLMGVDVQINSHGFRDAEHPLRKPEGEYRVLLLGDSLTFGWGAAAADTFATRLQEQLGARFEACGDARRVRVINTGVGNYNTDQQVSFFEIRGRNFEPDLVLLDYFINDAEPTPRQKSPWIIKYSYLGMAVWGRLDLLRRLYLTGEDFADYYPGLYGEDRAGWRQARDAFARLARLSREEGFSLVMFLLPELHAVGPEYGFQEIYDRVAAAATSAGIQRVIDLAPRFSGEDPETLWVALDDAHPNARAHTILAEGMYAELGRIALPDCTER